jgi:hypothetical protein
VLSTSSDDPTLTVIRRAASISAEARAEAVSTWGMGAPLIRFMATDNAKKWIPY